MHCILACVALWWPTTVTAKPKTSRQNHKPHGKTKNLTAKPKTSRQNQKRHVKTKNLRAKIKYLTAKPKTSRQKQNTSRQNQILHSKNKIALVLPWVFVFVSVAGWKGRKECASASPACTFLACLFVSCTDYFQAPATPAWMLKLVE